MSYKTTFNNGTIILPKKVIKKLNLQNGDYVRIHIARLGEFNYAYLANQASEVWRELFKTQH